MHNPDMNSKTFQLEDTIMCLFLEVQWKSVSSQIRILKKDRIAMHNIMCRNTSERLLFFSNPPKKEKAKTKRLKAQLLNEKKFIFKKQKVKIFI